MATRDELYAKFGITAEAAQLFEVELGTLLLCARAIEQGWNSNADSDKARELLNNIDRSTLGQLLQSLKKCVELGEDLADRFASALKTRNRLFHRFFETHNFKIQTDEGRSEMMADLEAIHIELFNAWRIASGMSAGLTSFFHELRSEST